MAKKRLFYKLLVAKAVFSLIFTGIPQPANASVISSIEGLFSSRAVQAAKKNQTNSQNMLILQSAQSPDLSFARGGGDITVIGETALLPDSGPLGTQADIPDSEPFSGQISVYVVREGDTLGAIAKMFDVSVNTIIWANDLRGSTIAPGDKLIILPVSGIQYIIKKGDTVKSVAKKYKADIGDILAFNGLSDDTVLKVGETIVIPDGVMETPKQTKSPTRYASGPSYDGYYMRPISYEEGRRSQGIHGWNGIDIGAAVGTPVVAAASGEVIIARGSGWNGGYGLYVVIKHGNGTQTLYGHMSNVSVVSGMNVAKGQVVGQVGSTGRSTGPHLHFEVRGAKNPF